MASKQVTVLDNQKADYATPLAKFLQSFSSCKPVWYSLKPPDEKTGKRNVPSLPELTGMDYKMMMIYFCLCGFVKLNGDNFHFLLAKFEEFVLLNNLTNSVEYTSVRKKGGGGGKHHYLCIGNRAQEICNKPGHPTTKQVRIPGISKRRSMLHEAVSEASKSRKLDLPNGDEAVSNNEVASRSRAHASSQNDDIQGEPLVVLRLRARLLPLIDSNEGNDQQRKKEIEATLFDIVNELHQQREEELTAILGSTVTPMSPNTMTNPQVFPLLKHYGISLKDPRLLHALLLELFQLKERTSTDSTIHIDLGNNMKTAYVRVPPSTIGGYGRLAQNEKKHKWLSSLLTALGGVGSEQETIQDLMVYIARQPKYKESVVDALRMNGMRLLPKLDSTATFAIQSYCNLNAMQLTMLRRCFQAELGGPILSSPFQIKRTLGLEHIEPIGGVYRYGSERIEWMYKSVPQIVTLFLSNQFAGKHVGEDFNIDHVDLSVCVDHGKGHSRATLTLVIRWRRNGEDGAGGSLLSSKQEVFSIANAKCRKDNTDIIRNTFGPSLNEDLKKIKEDGCLTFMVDAHGSTERGYFVFGDGSHVERRRDHGDIPVRTIPVELWMAGDLLWYSTALGKEGFATWWCAYCRLFRPNWSLEGHEKGQNWTLERLRNQADRIVGGQVNMRSALEVNGVKEAPVFDAVDIDHYVCPTLHLTIGLGNDLLKNLIVEVQAACERYTDEYLQAERDTNMHSALVAEVALELANYNDLHNQYEKDLKRMLQGRQRRQLSVEEIEFHSSEVQEIGQQRDIIRERLDTHRNGVNVAKVAFRETQKDPANSKAFGQPVLAGIDDILRLEGIDRGQHFGGDLEGNGCRRLMASARDIMGKIYDYILSLPQEQRMVGTDEQIREVLQVHQEAFASLDGLVSGLRTVRFHVTADTIRRTRLFAQHCVARFRHLGMSVTPKLHCVEDHAIDLLTSTQGFGDLGEDTGERAHQQEAKLDRRLGAVRNYRKKENCKSKAEVMAGRADVKVKMESLRDNGRLINYCRRPTAATGAKRQRTLDAREEVLLSQMPVGQMRTLRDMRKDNR